MYFQGKSTESVSTPLQVDMIASYLVAVSMT